MAERPTSEHVCARAGRAAPLGAVEPAAGPENGSLPRAEAAAAQRPQRCRPSPKTPLNAAWGTP
eukprot:11173592-Lingulodinium_polyedra.AAC.1